MNSKQTTLDKLKPPRSCDTFAVLPPGTLDGCVVFGKNSDRPSDEVQEVIYCPSKDYPPNTKLKCTYIKIDQAPRTYAVVLSKPAWMWGAEMGANEHDVCIGNEAVWTKLNDDSDSIKKLIGMDLLRLGLERGATALEALNVIVKMIETHGMGGNCSDTIEDFTYHNSFLIADPNEAWILECAGKIWAAEKVTEGVRNISNELSIGSRIDMKCNNIEAVAEECGWKPSERPLSFMHCFSLCTIPSRRYSDGKRLLQKYSSGNKFAEVDMFKVLRDKPSGICMSSGAFVSTGSQVSVLAKPGSGKHSCHWFTGTPDPATSVFKPFYFTDNVEFPDEILSPNNGHDYKHKLYKLHEEFSILNRLNKAHIIKSAAVLESKYVDVSKDIVSNWDGQRAKCLFKNAVEDECNMYKC